MKVLIIDEDMVSLSFFLETLVNEYTIEYKFFKENALDSLNYIKENDVDGVFISSNLLSVNSFELVRRLLEVHKDLRLVFLGAIESRYQEEFKENILGVCSKPLSLKQIEVYLDDLQRYEKKEINIKTFGSFDVFVNGKIVKFKSVKSKELLALLITYNGKSLHMSDAICHLWPDKHLELAKRLYRDAIWKLRKTLREYEISHIIDFKRAQIFLCKENIICDYWEYLKYPNDHKYNGVFLSSYDWSLEFQSELDRITIKRKIDMKS